MDTTTIDRKFVFKAVNPCNGKEYTEKNALVLCAKDKAVLPAMRAYYDACVNLGCDEFHLESIELLVDRIRRYQREVESKIPDSDSECEIRRCVGGEI